MSTVPLTNTTEDGAVPGLNPDATTDYFLISDYNNDKNYFNAKICEVIKFLSSNPTNDFQILYGGVITDSGSSQIDITAGAAIGKDASGNIRIVTIPALTNVALPSGWANNRQIWLIGKYAVKLDSPTRQHFNGTTYAFKVLDSYLGEGATDNLFVDADPGATVVKWGSFKMNGTTFADQLDRTSKFVIFSAVAPGLLDYKWSARKFSPSVSEPWFRADSDQTLLAANWPLLTPELRTMKLEIGAASIFNVTGFVTGSTTRLQLEDNVTTRNLMRALLEDYHYSKSYTATTNADGTDDDTAFSAWAFIVRVVTDIGTGTNAPKAGQEYRVKYLTSLAETLSVTNRYIRVDKDTSSLATTGAGTIEIYPYRIAAAGVPTTTSAKWRAVSESGLMTPGAKFYSGTDLVEVPANVRVRDSLQGHYHGSLNTNFSVNEVGMNYGGGAGIYVGQATSATTGDPVTDTVNGTLRTAPKTNQRSHLAYLYGYGGEYTP